MEPNGRLLSGFFIVKQTEFPVKNTNGTAAFAVSNVQTAYEIAK